MPLKAAPALVEATGEVAAQRTETGHLQLAIEVARLAPAAMLAPDTVLYVVWAAPVGGGAVQNLGTLQVRDDRTGRMRATALFAESLRVEITPERAADLSSPTHDPVLWTALPGD